jgi:methionyl aminopeptidase
MLTSAILDMVGQRIEAGVTTNQINSWVHEYTVSNGAYPAPLNYRGFPKSVCTSINKVVCHGIPDETILKDGDIINVDVTCILDGFYGDASRMYLIGNVSSKAKKLVTVTKECLELGLAQVKPYAELNDIGKAIQKHAHKNNFSIVYEYGGHGTGCDFHENLFLHHYDTGRKTMILVPNMVFTIEPMINIGKPETKLLKDKWTAETIDGELSAQWEHTLRVTETGYEIFC